MFRTQHLQVLQYLQVLGAKHIVVRDVVGRHFEKGAGSEVIVMVIICNLLAAAPR